ncbi:hypothetical protein TIFTF001_028870 [Ficus carica]|uniref:Uncharacterized protein n=1 Tax=Ficus carica TaxID=3494 RepID=A0AA88DQU4_FICCA|nr:hypothetical protein TIFTF001_028870 [Ficus carica]
MSAGVNSVQSVGVTCVYCGEGHLYEDCPSNPASACYMGNFNRNNLYSAPYNQGFPSQQPRTQAMESSSSLENLIKEYIAKNDARVQSHDATLRSLENQIGQIANALNVRPQGSLPSNTEDPRREGKEHCKNKTSHFNKKKSRVQISDWSLI